MDEKDLDIEFLARRAYMASCIRFGDYERETGASSNSIVAIAYGFIEPVHQELPSDDSDLMACERMWKKLPEHRKANFVVNAMGRARNYRNEKE
ncbi:MAG: hypothetical protein ACRCUT_14000 [Spirochaetota bacterium]